MTRTIKYALVAALTAILAGCGRESTEGAKRINALPDIFPDYAGVTVPCNIAPLNFNMAGSKAQKIDVVIKGAQGGSIHSQGNEASNIDAGEWRDLLAANAGSNLTFAVSAKYDDGWRSYKPFEIHVSADSIDYGLTYRLIAPGYEVYSHLGIYQRELGSYLQTAILENTQVDGCMNCHSYNRCDPKDMSLHVRGPHGATLLRKDGRLTALNTATDSTLASCVYPYWHPNGRYIAYSTNNTRQVFHVADLKRVEVFDLASDLQVYDTETNTLLVPAILQQDSVLETFPAFSADGKKLYFCAANMLPNMSNDMTKVRYDLCSIDFDAATGTFGNKIDTLVNASARGKSIAFPRPSFDGRYLMYSQGDYGSFMIWHPESDLWLLDLASGETRALDEANSPGAESYHNWSSNSRWYVFGSRRDDGLHTRAYIAHLGADGRSGKPFLLPQENPRRYYDNQYRSYNVPEFVSAPVNLDRFEAQKVLFDSTRLQVIPKILK